MRRAAVLAILLLGSCAPRSSKVVAGSKVSVRYSLWADGRFVESNEQGAPLTFTAGRCEVVAGFDEGLLGLAAGEDRRFMVSPGKGYGLADPTAISKMPETAFSGLGVALKAGMKVQVVNDGRAAEGKVLSVEAGQVTLDFNHPLAGQTLEFRVKVLSVR